MRHMQISQEHRATSARRCRDADQLLTTELRDPDIVRAKRLMKRAACRKPTGRGKTAT
jgi:hypothetical protein